MKQPMIRKIWQFIHTHPRCQSIAIATALGITTQTAAAFVTMLKEQGLIEVDRVHSAERGRKVNYYSTITSEYKTGRVMSASLHTTTHLQAFLGGI